MQPPPVEIAPETPPEQSAPAGPVRVALSADSDVELIGEFVTECKDLLEKSEAALLLLETNPADMDSVNTVFRTFHTIKGTSGFLGLLHIQEFAHFAESLLSRVRDKEIRFAASMPTSHCVQRICSKNSSREFS